MKLLNAWALAWRKQIHTMIKQANVIEATCLSTLWITMNGGEKKQIWRNSTASAEDGISNYYSIKVFLIAREKVTLLVYRPRNKMELNSLNNQQRAVPEPAQPHTPPHPSQMHGEPWPPALLGFTGLLTACVCSSSLLPQRTVQPAPEEERRPSWRTVQGHRHRRGESPSVSRSRACGSVRRYGC